MTQLVFKAIIPSTLNIGVYARELKKALDAEAEVHRKELAKTTAQNKKIKPVFKTKIVEEQNDTIAWTRPTGSKKSVDIWEFSNLGTVAHTITARRAPTLRFQTGYRARTKPKKFTSGKSSRFGPFATPKSVRNPGIQVRLWTETLTKKRKRPYISRMRKAMRIAGRQSFK